MKVRVFTDGACSSNGKEGAKASYAYYFPDNKDFSKAERVPDNQPQTNNRGELMAISEAVKTMIEKFPIGEIDVQIYTDSMYSKNCLTIWLPGFIERNWKTSGYKGAATNEVKNRDIIEETTKLLPKFKSYTISYVAAHTGKDDELSKCNEIVDRMAVSVLDPAIATVKIIHTNQEKPIEGFPVELMGPPVTANVILRWCKDNLDKLDEDTLDNALMAVVTKTLKKKGFELEKQRLHRTALYRLLSSHLIAENTHIIKEEE
jgi:ribonuclease HI